MRLAVELDGSQHLEAAGLGRDARRTEYLAERGVRVVRFSDRDVLQAPESVVEVLVRLLEGERLADR